MQVIGTATTSSFTRSLKH